MQGLGNDFVLIDARRMKQLSWSDLAIKMCERHLGIGSDGLLLLLDSHVADYRMRMFNPDGSESGACGNGLRCLVRYIFEKGISEKGKVDIDTLAGVRHAQLVKRGGKVKSIRVSMGQPVLQMNKIPVIADIDKGQLLDIMLADYPLDILGRDLRLSFVSMGNPHAVHFISSPVIDFPLAEIGPKVEKHKMFPEGTNFEIVQMTGLASCEVRVWERGAGETLACGSGACAVAVAARMKGLAEEQLRIKLPGGTAEVEWDGRGEVGLSGPAEFVFTGQWRLN